MNGVGGNGGGSNGADHSFLPTSGWFGDGSDGVLELREDLHMTRRMQFERVEWLGGMIYTHGWTLCIQTGPVALHCIVAAGGQLMWKVAP